ncbi:MAG: nuclear transport factor 2 family protein [Gemmatimonadetes bacterium]|nr:nuclear transport factor 2 family protein [Gemmatimonadota bacterium]
MRLARLASVFVAFSLLPRTAAAQGVSGPSTDSARIHAVVVQLFDAMRARDTAVIRSLFVPNASMQSLRDTAVVFDRVDGWVTSIARAPQGVLLDERIGAPTIQIDGPLATVWVEYWFFVGPRFSHCGVDAFQLLQGAGRWRIFSIVDTRRTAGCGEPPGR